MLKSSKLFVVLAILALSAGAAMAQVPGAGDRVVLDGAAVAQGTNEVGDPANGAYDVLINGYIGPYARVSAYDNWINFGIMSPTDGTYDAPSLRYAWLDPLVGADEEGSLQPNLTIFGNLGSDWSSHDCAGLQIQTNARLDLAIDFDSPMTLYPGYMRKVDAFGVEWPGYDTRRQDGPVDYQLRNQMKMAFRGRFLNYVATDDPAYDDDGTQYESITSGELTDYGTWTQWSPGANTIETAAAGWFEPTTTNEPWHGLTLPAIPASTAPYTTAGTPALGLLNLVVERGQAGESAAVGAPTAAEVLFASRILRRGLQDVQGNYRSDIVVSLSYREGDVDAQWNPDVWTP